MINEFVLNIQRFARESTESQFRLEALALLKRFIPFDSASWGTTRPDGVGVKPCSVQLLGQTEALVNSYLHVRAHDPIGFKTIAHPGQAHILNWKENYGGAHETFRSHCEQFNHYNILSTMSNKLCGDQHNFVTFARGKESSFFTESERCLLERLMPHLLDAWITNRRWHMKEAVTSEMQGRVACSACSPNGALLGDCIEFVAILKSEFPDWAPPQLVPEVMQSLVERATWRGRGIEVRSYPIADVIFLTAHVDDRLNALTNREIAIAKRASRGLTYKEIAREFSLSPATVRSHLHNIYGKLEISNKTALSRVISDLQSGDLDQDLPVA